MVFEVVIKCVYDNHVDSVGEALQHRTGTSLKRDHKLRETTRTIIDHYTRNILYTGSS